MAHIHSIRSTALRAAFAALAALACVWAVDAFSDGPTLSLADLANHQSVLMSCESASPVGAALMWCSDPDSPQCIPALPQPPRTELWDRSDFALPTLPPLPRQGYVWMTWPEHLVVDMPGRSPSQRLERPPRA
ncbi:MAG: hypothetical protein ABW352_01865 [Polyangiales bacterium]